MHLVGCWTSKNKHFTQFQNIKRLLFGRSDFWNKIFSICGEYQGHITTKIWDIRSSGSDVMGFYLCVHFPPNFQCPYVGNHILDANTFTGAKWSELPLSACQVRWSLDFTRCERAIKLHVFLFTGSLRGPHTPVFQLFQSHPCLRPCIQLRKAAVHGLGGGNVFCPVCLFVCYHAE